MLQDPDARVRANVVETLALTKDASVLEKIRPLLRDASTRARINAMVTIADAEGVSAVAEWMPVFQQLAHGDRHARSAAAYALGKLPFEGSVDLLVELLKDPEMRTEAAQALGHVGSARAVPQLVEALAGPPELRHDTRRAIAAILERSDWKATEELMQTALRSDRPEIRSELADVLGRLKDLRVLNALIPLLKDPEWRVRWKVLKSFERLARLGPLPDNARAALFDYARDELAAFRHSLLCSGTLVPHPSGPGRAGSRPGAGGRSRQDRGASLPDAGRHERTRPHAGHLSEAELRRSTPEGGRARGARKPGAEKRRPRSRGPARACSCRTELPDAARAAALFTRPLG